MVKAPVNSGVLFFYLSRCTMAHRQKETEMNTTRTAYIIETQKGKIALLEKSLSVLRQAAYDEQKFTLQESISEHYAFAISKLQRTLNLTKIKLENHERQM